MMKIIVDKMPRDETECPFYEYDYDQDRPSCKLRYQLPAYGNYCRLAISYKPNTPEGCPHLITFEDMLKKGVNNDK